MKKLNANPVSLQARVDKAKSSLVVIVSVAAVISVFCLVSTKALLSQGSYQRHVIAARSKAYKQLKDNINNANQLVTQYNQVFENSGPINIIGGKNDTSPNAVPPDGDNARIVLDGLPSSYDFPALVTSMSKILNSDGITNPGVGGSDQSISISNEPSGSPTPVSISIPISGTATYPNLIKLLNDLQRSIRPFDITNLQISGGVQNMTFSMQTSTYFQPAKKIDVTSKVVNK
jgi:hypothetical protein